MFPRVTVNQSPDRALVNVVFAGQASLLFTVVDALQNALGVVLRQFGVDILVATRRLRTEACMGRRTIATLCFSVAVVVCWGAQKKMRRITAQRIVAAMTHAQTGVNHATGRLVRDAMRAPLTTIYRLYAIAVSCCCASPWPAPIAVAPIHIIPELFHN